MDIVNNKNECIIQLKNIAETKGYLVFDDIISKADHFSLPITVVEQVTTSLQQYGIILYPIKPTTVIDETPKKSEERKYEDMEYEDYSQINYDELYDSIIEICPGMERFIEEVRRIVPPQYGEFSQLISQAKEGNEYAQKRIFNSNLRQAIRIVWNTYRNEQDLEDAIQVAAIGLMRALKKYDPSGFQVFGSYLGLWVTQYLNRFGPYSASLFYFSAHGKEQLRLARRLLEQIDLDPPYELNVDIVSYLSKELEIEEEKAIQLINYLNPQLYLDDISDEIDNLSYYDDYSRIENDLVKQAIKQAFQSLKQREIEVLNLRYGLNDDTIMTLEEIGQIYGLTRERIRQIEARALNKLRAPNNKALLIDLL